MFYVPIAAKNSLKINFQTVFTINYHNSYELNHLKEINIKNMPVEEETPKRSIHLNKTQYSF